MTIKIEKLTSISMPYILIKIKMLQHKKKYIHCILAIDRFIQTKIAFNYPKEIIQLIITLAYKPLQIYCGGYNTTFFFDDKILINGDWGNGQLAVSNNKINREKIQNICLQRRNYMLRD